MSDAQTHITITLKHSRELTEAEFKNLFGNISEHIHGERGVDGFTTIVGTNIVASHYDYRSSSIEPVHETLRCSTRVVETEENSTSEFAF
jgi:hypothetical protein